MFDLEKFKELLSVPSKTYQEEDMVEYICDELNTIPGVSYYRDEMMNIYATKGELSEGEFYPMFIAHTDTVHQKVDKIIVKEETLIRPNTFGKQFNNKMVPCLKAYTEDNKPTGIGGDDKCGVFICLELLKTLDKVKVGLFVSEETGCHGSRVADPKFFENVGYAIQFDAPGNVMVSEYCMGTQLFDRESDFFVKCDQALTEGFEGRNDYQSHPYTDVYALKKQFDFSCINFAIGYYDYHTKNEYVVIEDVFNGINSGRKIIELLGCELYKLSK